jgi:hypothetical protein
MVHSSFIARTLNSLSVLQPNYSIRQTRRFLQNHRDQLHQDTYDFKLMGATHVIDRFYFCLGFGNYGRPADHVRFCKRYL